MPSKHNNKNLVDQKCFVLKISLALRIKNILKYENRKCYFTRICFAAFNYYNSFKAQRKRKLVLFRLYFDFYRIKELSMIMIFSIRISALVRYNGNRIHMAIFKDIFSFIIYDIYI